MWVIDEVSFLDERNIVKLDKHLRLLKESDLLFGGVLIVFVGVFSIATSQGIAII